jgi:hypothetical protein
MIARAVAVMLIYGMFYRFRKRTTTSLETGVKIDCSGLPIKSSGLFHRKSLDSDSIAYPEAAFFILPSRFF